MPLSLEFLALALGLAAGTSGLTAGLTDTSCLADSAGGSGLLQVHKGRLSDEAVVNEMGRASRSVSIHIGLDNYPVLEWHRHRPPRQAASGLIARKRMVDRREAASFLEEADQGAVLASLSAALDSVLASGASIDELSTDLRGHDFAVVKAVGQSRLQRVGMVTAEVWDAKSATHNGLKNSLHEHWIPYMQLLGFSAQANCTLGREEDGIGARECTFMRGA